MKKFLAILFILFLSTGNAFATQYYYDETPAGRGYVIERTDTYGGSSAFRRFGNGGGNYYYPTGYYRHTVSGSYRKHAVFRSTQQNSRLNKNNVKTSKNITYRNGISYYN